MCGIAGWIDYKNPIAGDDKTIEKMSKTLMNRGPDEGGVYKSENAVLIHRRLTVVDPQNGKQPMTLPFGGTVYTLIYNGELYNTEDIRKELLKLGHKFNGHSDTEVLFHAYAQWGAACLERLNGIYAFAVWDERDESLFLARDRMGVKPLFFYPYDNGLVFGSQLKTLLANPHVKPYVEEQGLMEIFMIGPGRTGGNGVFKGVHEVFAGHFMEFSRQGTRDRCYWRLHAREHKDDFKTTVEKTRHLISDAIRRQLVSDVPLCTMLSGGLDSSIISYVAAESYRDQGRTLDTYSVDYRDNDKFFKKSVFQPNSDDEYIKMMTNAIGSNHHKVTLDNASLAEALPEAAIARDLPGMADIDSSLLLFCRAIKKDFTVSVSGECADEVFGGYPWYHNSEILKEEGFPWSRLLDIRRSILKPHLLPNAEEYVRQRYLSTIRDTETFEGEPAQERRIREMMRLNLDWFMCTLLDRKDRMSMQCGLEVRVPFCDHRIVEYAYNIPWEMKAYQGREKGLVREAFKGILPDEIVFRKKSPYPKTHNPIFMRLVTEMVLKIRSDQDSRLQGLINWETVDGLIKSPDSLKTTWYGQLMGVPQILAYIVQMDTWFNEFNVELV